MALETYSLIFFIIFLVLLGGVAIWSGRQNKLGTAGADVEYYLGGRQTPYFVLAFSFITSSVSAGAFIGDPAMMATHGWSYYWIVIAIVPGMVIPSIFLMRKMRLQAEKLGSLTIPEYLGDRYNSSFLRLLISILVVVCYLFVLVAQFKGAAILLEKFTGVSFNLGLVIITAVVVFYVVSGGLRSVAWTDFVQGIPMLILAIVVLVLSLNRVGGFSGLEAGLQALNPALLTVVDKGPDPIMNVGGIIGNFAFWFVIFISQPYLCSRFLAIPSVNRNMIGKFLLLSLSLALVYNLFYIVGLTGRVMFPNTEADYITVSVVTELLSPVLAAIMMVGFFGAILTTATSILLTVGQSIGRDIYAKSINKKATPKQEILVTRIGVIVVALFVMLFNFVQTPALLSLFIYIGLSGLGACIGVPLFAAIASEKATKGGAIASVIAGPIVYLIITNFVGWNYMIACLLALVVSSILMISISVAQNKKKDNLLVERAQVV